MAFLKKNFIVIACCTEFLPHNFFLLLPEYRERESKSHGQRFVGDVQNITQEDEMPLFALQSLQHFLFSETQFSSYVYFFYKHNSHLIPNYQPDTRYQRVFLHTEFCCTKHNLHKVLSPKILIHTPSSSFLKSAFAIVVVH